MAHGVTAHTDGHALSGRFVPAPGALAVIDDQSTNRKKEEPEMTVKNTVNSYKRPVKPRLSGAERRAAEIAALAGKQAQLKREAAERRAERARREAETPSQPPTNRVTRRRRSR